MGKRFEITEQLKQAIKMQTKVLGRFPTSHELVEVLREMYGIQIASRTVQYKLKQLGYEGFETVRKDHIKRYMVTEIGELVDKVAPVLDTPMRLSGDWAITSDWHIPAVSMKWFKLLLDKCKKYKIKRLAIVGDFMNFDLLSRWYTQNLDIRTTKISDEILVAKQIIKTLDKQFDEVFICMGNHEKARLLRAMCYGIDISEMLEFLGTSPKWRGTGLSYFYIDDIRVTHPRSYRQVKLSTAIALSYKFNCSVLQAHGHFFSVGYNANGQVVGDTGGLFDWQRVRYLFETGDTTHPMWNNGFFIYKNKKLIPFGERIGD